MADLTRNITRDGSSGIRRVQFGHVDVETGSLGATFTNIPGLDIFTLEPNKKYAFEFSIQAYTDQTTTGIDVAVSGPAGFTRLSYQQPRYGSTGIVKTIATIYDNDTLSGTGPTTGTPGRNFDFTGVIETGATGGTFAARIKREAAGTAPSGTGPSVMPGSWGRVWEELFT